MTHLAKFYVSKCQAMVGLTKSGKLKLYLTNKYLDAFKTVLLNMTELEAIFCDGNNIPSSRIVETTVQGLIDGSVGTMLSSVAGLGMLGAASTERVASQNQHYEAAIISEESLIAFINSVLTMAHTWNVNNFYSAKNEIRSWLIRLTK